MYYIEGMLTRDMIHYLIQHMSELALTYPSDHMVNELAQTYIRLVGHKSSCVTASDKTNYDSTMIAAMGTVVWLAQKDIKEEEI